MITEIHTQKIDKFTQHATEIWTDGQGLGVRLTGANGFINLDLLEMLSRPDIDPNGEGLLGTVNHEPQLEGERHGRYCAVDLDDNVPMRKCWMGHVDTDSIRNFCKIALAICDIQEGKR